MAEEVLLQGLLVVGEECLQGCLAVVVGLLRLFQVAEGEFLVLLQASGDLVAEGAHLQGLLVEVQGFLD